MKVVTVANVVLNRPGTLGGSGFPSFVSDGSPKERRDVILLKSADRADILQGVKELAVQYGESEGYLPRLNISMDQTGRDTKYIINESSEAYGTVYGKCYAECTVSPALELDGRYFRLQEIYFKVT